MKTYSKTMLNRSENRNAELRAELVDSATHLVGQRAEEDPTSAWAALAFINEDTREVFFTDITVGEEDEIDAEENLALGKLGIVSKSDKILTAPAYRLLKVMEGNDEIADGDLLFVGLFIAMSTANSKITFKTKEFAKDGIPVTGYLADGSEVFTLVNPGVETPLVCGTSHSILKTHLSKETELMEMAPRYQNYGLLTRQDVREEIAKMGISPKDMDINDTGVLFVIDRIAYNLMDRIEGI